jgi:hypothetical protein
MSFGTFELGARSASHLTSPDQVHGVPVYRLLLFGGLTTGCSRLFMESWSERPVGKQRAFWLVCRWFTRFVSLKEVCGRHFRKKLNAQPSGGMTKVKAEESAGF